MTAGQNSFNKYQYGKFTGTFNTIGAGLWAHTAGVLGAGLTLKGAVKSAYAAPTQTADGSLADISAVTPIASGATVLFSTTGPYDASPVATIAAPGYSQYLVTQLQTTVAAGPGNTATVTTTMQWNET